MDRESGTRSGLLWEVERLLKETKEKPQILIMENVPQVLSAKGWREWNVFLESLGYSNYTQILNAKCFGIPQNRERCFMVSILGDYSYEFPRPFELKDRLRDFLETNVDEKYYLSKEKLQKISQWKAQQDPLKDIEKEKNICPCITARGAGEEHSGMILINESLYNDKPKLVGGIGEMKSNGGTQYYQQDRIYDGNGIAMCHPANLPSGSYMYQLSDFTIRKLTPCECFKLMGVKKKDYEKITCNDREKYRQSGNSIVTTVLMAIYSQLFENCDYKYYIEELLKELRTNGNNIESE